MDKLTAPVAPEQVVAVGYLAFQSEDSKGVFFPTMVHMTSGTLRWHPPVSRVVPLYAAAGAPPAATPAAPSAATDERKALIAAHNAIEGLIAWDARRDYPVPYKVREPLHEALNLARAALAQPAPVQAVAQQAAAYLLTRPSGFSWVLMPFDITPYTRAIFDAEGTTITPLHAAPVQQDAPAPSMVGDAKGGA